jgi:hypothetical protein
MNHRSTTHEEIYHHFPINDPFNKYRGATFFARNATPPNPFQTTAQNWGATVAVCSIKDEFIRKRGRTVARRRYFQEQPVAYFNHKPTWEEAGEVVAHYLNQINGLID